jgi:putative transcriptional regulator
MDKELFTKLKKSLGHMESHASGQKVKGVREVTREVKSPRPFSKDEIIELRRRLGVSQSGFAVLLNISPRTVQKWEQGENRPNGSSLRLLAIARKLPRALYIS